MYLAEKNIPCFFHIIQALLENTNILKLLECQKCNQVCDRYLEVIIPPFFDKDLYGWSW